MRRCKSFAYAMYSEIFFLAQKRVLKEVITWRHIHVDQNGEKVDQNRESRPKSPKSGLKSKKWTKIATACICLHVITSFTVFSGPKSRPSSIQNLQVCLKMRKYGKMIDRNRNLVCHISHCNMIFTFSSPPGSWRASGQYIISTCDICHTICHNIWHEIGTKLVYSWYYCCTCWSSKWLFL